MPKAEVDGKSGDDQEYKDPQKQTDNTPDNRTLEEKHWVIIKVFFHNIMDFFKNLNRIRCLHCIIAPLFFIK